MRERRAARCARREPSVRFSLWEEVIRNNVPPKTIDVNLEAFHLGANYMQGE